MHLSIPRDSANGLKPTRRVLVDDLPEFIITHCREVVTTDVLLELRVRPEAGSGQEELHHVKRFTHVTLTLDKAKRVPSSSQSPEVGGLVGQQGNGHVNLALCHL